MIFYLIPPRNIIEFSDFSKCCSERLSYFFEVGKTQNYESIVQKFDVEPRLDQIGHFVLRCFCAYRPEVEDFIIARETDLFFYRLDKMPWEIRRKLCQNTVEQIRQLHDSITRKAKLLRLHSTELCETLSIPEIEEHLCGHCDIGCKKYIQKVPFQMCFSLVQNRSVVVENGFAFVPCSMWNLLLVELFHHIYKFGLSTISNIILPVIKSDKRWTVTFAELGKLYDSFKRALFTTETRLTATQIDDEKRYFPPCMAHLLTVLRTNHRLSHLWRFRFTIFLKDIGLSVEESIKFWENEYSKSCTAESSCTHSWQMNKKKYEYNIYHSYGLKGSSQNYETMSCFAYQNVQLGIREEGGCPFVHFDDTNLSASLSKEIREDPIIINKIREQRTLKNSMQACYIYQAACARQNGLQIPSQKFKSPKEYYQGMKVCCDTTLKW